MHGVNLDLLHAMTRYHSDGRPKDPHARYRQEHLAACTATRLSERGRAWPAVTEWLRRRLRTLIRSHG